MYQDVRAVFASKSKLGLVENFYSINVLNNTISHHFFKYFSYAQAYCYWSIILNADFASFVNWCLFAYFHSFRYVSTPH